MFQRFVIAETQIEAMLIAYQPRSEHENKYGKRENNESTVTLCFKVPGDIFDDFDGSCTASVPVCPTHLPPPFTPPAVNTVMETQGDAVRNLTWPAWEVGKKALVFPSAPGKPLPLEEPSFAERLQDFLNTRQVLLVLGWAVVG